MLLFIALALSADPATVREGVSQDRLMADMRALTGVDALDDGTRLESRSVYHPQIEDAEEWMFTAMSAIDGLQVEREPFDWTGPYPLANIVAELPGVDPSLPPVVVMAHYDSTASLDEGWQAETDPAPGADDDASGISAILEIARVLSSWEPGFARTIRFVGFSAEEVGLVGSTAHVAAMDGPVLVAIALDPVGHNPGGSDRLWFSFDERWSADADALLALAVDEDLLDVAGVDADLIGGDERSDHFPFWEAGHCALHVGTFPLPPAYHTPDDTLEVVDPEFLTEVTILIGAHVSALAEPLPPEEARACACNSSGSTGWFLFLAAPWLRRRRADLDDRG